MEAKTETEQFVADMEAAFERMRKDSLQRWCNEAVEFMEMLLNDYARNVERADPEYLSAQFNWEDEEKREKIVNELKKKAQLQRKYYEAIKKEVMYFEASKELLFPPIKSNENSTKRDSN